MYLFLFPVTLPILQSSCKHTTCVVCGKKEGPLHRVSDKARYRVYVTRGVLLAKGSRCCDQHLVVAGKERLLQSNAINLIRTTSEEIHTSLSEVGQFVGQLVVGLRDEVRQQGMKWEDPSQLTDTDYWYIVGLQQEQFEDLLKYVEGHIRMKGACGVRTALAVFLAKMRTGGSHELLGTIFGLPKHVISRCITRCRKVLMTTFVPSYLGFEHITRDEIRCQHTRPFANALFGTAADNVILVADGTYIYIEKSGDYLFQRRTFSIHKGRPLIKPMMIVTTTGYILAVLGPYFADGRNNDASIFRSLLANTNTAFRTWLKDSDVIVVDRGFRDCLDLLEEIGLLSQMPHFLAKGKQHTTLEANESRLVTSVRWVVEATNGLLKTWKLFKNVLPNSHIPYIGDYLRIVCALCNAYRPPRVVDPEDEIVAQRMLALVHKPNILQQRAENEGWSRKQVIWEPLTSTAVSDFPRLTLQEIRELTLGVYQIKQARSYTREHKDSHSGMYELSLHRQESNILRIQLQSRHTSAKRYNLWLSFSSTHVTAWYCQCKSGARTVGCCAHIASVIWYLAYDRYTPDTVDSSYGQFLQDSA